MRLILQLELPADARLLPATRQAVEGYLMDVGAGEDERACVVLAVSEACANVIRHAFPTAGDGRIHVRTEISDHDVRIQVEDDGVGFDPLAPRPEPGEYDTSGRGLYIISELMSHVELESPTESGGTRVRMRKSLSGDGTPVAGGA
jgi:anti-sigma regulatory factor (Ser/Thr protein kinase)